MDTASLTGSEISTYSQRNKERTLGDGMDNTLLNLSETLNKNHVKKLNIRLSNKPVITFNPIEPTGEKIPMVPKYVPIERKQPKYLIRKPKEPKFIPYEPYKGAVEPIITSRTKKKHVPEIKSSKNNVEINDLVAQMSEIRSIELKKINKEIVDIEETVIPKKQWENERNAYENDIKNLWETNAHLENQLKFQAQVNSELKTLLVAAVGEDLESRVQHLTEDKLQLARALLNSANHLTSHQEQTEWLSGQCEVWRSKFLASSLMVEELARWKSALTTRVNDIQESLKELLDDRYKIHKISLKTYCSLQHAVEKLNGVHVNLKSSNIIEVENANFTLSQQVNSLVNSTDDKKCDKMLEECLKLSEYTISEKNAMKLLQNPVTISNNQDAICSALLGTAMSMSGEQMYLQHPSHQATCCSHCTGEIKNI